MSPFSGLGRQWSLWSLSTKALAIIAVPLAPLLLTTLIFYVTDRREREAQAATTRSAEISAELQATFMLVVEAETGTRGFLLTGDRAFLEAFTQGVALLPGRFQRVEALVRDPDVRERLGIFHELVDRRMFKLASVQKSPRVPANLALLAEVQEGKQEMDRARAAMRELVEMERALLERRRERARQFQQASLAVVLTGAFLGILGGIGAAVLFSRGIVHRVRHVHENTEHLAASQSLRAGPDGDDEVAALGRGVHHAAELLGERDSLLRVRMDELAVSNNELEAFSYSVSHDLRAPLRHIAGFATLLEKRAAGRLEEQDRRYLRTIIDAAARMGRLVDDLLSFSRMGRSEMLRTPIELGPILDEIIAEEMREQNGRTIEWTRRPMPGIVGDPAMLRVAFSNLISNAVKYTSTREQAEIEIGTAGPSNGEAVLFVRDNGVGFDMQYVDKLFGVFQRLHPAEEFEGTGIGLASVRRVIQRHGGRTWADSMPGEGATFYIALPVETKGTI